MRRGNSLVGLVIGVFFLGGGLALRRAGESGWPMGEAEDVLGTNPAGDVLEMIGTIWAGVGGLLIGLFLMLGLAGGRGRVHVEEADDAASVVARGNDADDLAEGLTRLAALKQQGLLSDDEWAQAKALFLGKPVDHRHTDARILEELHDLYRAGGLTESEFNMKKWEILARS